MVLATLISLLCKLGFRINWKKVIDPCQSLTFLGIRIDIPKGTLELDSDKVDKLVTRLETTLGKKRIGKKSLECLGGHLTWANTVIKWGRAHMNSIFQSIRNLNASTHKMRVTPAIIADIRWWISSLLHLTPWRAIWSRQLPVVSVDTDACLLAGGAFSDNSGAWIHTNWAIDRPALFNSHINIKELGMIREAIKCWGGLHPNHHFIIRCDNIAAVYMTNTGAARHPQAAAIMKDIAHMALTWNLTISAVFLPGRLNDLADSISRLHIPGQFLRLSSLLSARHMLGIHPDYDLLNNMSPLTLLFLLPQVTKLHNCFRSWTKS